MTWWKAFWAACVATLLGLAFWYNRKTYTRKSKKWCAIKAIVDTTLVLGLAFRLPVLLCGYVILWMTRPLIKRPVLRTTVGALIGIAVAFLSGYAIEFIVIAGIFAIDMVSGGVYRYWTGISDEKINWREELFGRRKRPAPAVA